MPVKDELIEFCRRVYAKGFVAATDGNLSVRTPDGSFWVTASGVCKGDVTPDDIVRTNADGEVLYRSKKPSTEFKMHLAIYKNRHDVNAVVHCHPVFATAFAAAGKTLDKPVFPEVILGIGKVPLCDYATPSTSALAESLLPHIAGSNVFLLRNHGAVATGKTLREAYYRMEKLEHAARTTVIAEMLGGAQALSPEKVKELYSIAASTYGISIAENSKF